MKKVLVGHASRPSLGALPFLQVWTTPLLHGTDLSLKSKLHGTDSNLGTRVDQYTLINLELVTFW